MAHSVRSSISEWAAPLFVVVQYAHTHISSVGTTASEREGEMVPGTEREREGKGGERERVRVGPFCMPPQKRERES